MAVFDISYNFSGRNVLITGGTNGIGRAIAERFLDAGARVFVIDVSPATPPFANGDGRGTSRYFQLDVNDTAGMDRVRSQLEDEGVVLDVIVPNAGINVRLPIEDISFADIDKIISTNLTAALNTVKIFTTILAREPVGNIVFTSSISAISGMNLRSTYTATKGGLSGLARSLAVEWGPRGIRVNAVGPGIIRASLIETYTRENPDRLEAAIRNTPLRRAGLPEEVADVTAFLASSGARFITGQTVFVDGGVSAGGDWW